MEIAEDLDATGLLCPLPVLKVRRRLSRLKPGEVMRLISDDPAALIDVPHFCAEAGHDLMETVETAEGHVFLIRKNG